MTPVIPRSRGKLIRNDLAFVRDACYNDPRPSVDGSNFYVGGSAPREVITSYKGLSGRPRRSLRQLATAEAFRLRLQSLAQRLREPAGLSPVVALHLSSPETAP